MATKFLSLPIVDLGLLSQPVVSPDEQSRLALELDHVLSTTGFAYLTNPPISFSHHDVFRLTREFFSLAQVDKMKIAKKTFCPQNHNTYRGYFPPQSGQPDNLKEGFEIGRQGSLATWSASKSDTIDLNEQNVWPAAAVYPPKSRAELIELHNELQRLSKQLLSLLALALGKPEDLFTNWTKDSISTLRLLHYPPQTPSERLPEGGGNEAKLCCTPHTDSGILTLLHQDPTGGLEVRNSSGQWIAAPYVSGSIVVNIGDLMARASGGRYVATFHRVRACGPGPSGPQSNDAMGRLSVPFFFEPGENCVVRSVEGNDDGIRYGDHVKAKMGTWVEFQGMDTENESHADSQKPMLEEVQVL